MRFPPTIRSVINSLLAAALAAGSLPARADTAGDVLRAARQFLAAEAARTGLVEAQFTVEVSGSPAKAQACPKPVSVEPADTQFPSRMRFVASCAAAGWSETYTLRAEVSAQVVVAASQLNSGQPIVADDLRLERRTLMNLQDALSDPAALVGMASRRTLRPGQLVDRRALAPAVLVRRGATVTIVARNQGILVSSTGEATETGRRDDVIGVRNSATGRVIRARVTGANEVEPVGIVHSPD